jgi:hypothetical protein
MTDLDSPLNGNTNSWPTSVLDGACALLAWGLKEYLNGKVGRVHLVLLVLVGLMTAGDTLISCS